MVKLHNMTNSSPCVPDEPKPQSLDDNWIAIFYRFSPPISSCKSEGLPLITLHSSEVS